MLTNMFTYLAIFGSPVFVYTSFSSCATMVSEISMFLIVLGTSFHANMGICGRWDHLIEALASEFLKIQTYSSAAN